MEVLKQNVAAGAEAAASAGLPYRIVAVLLVAIVGCSLVQSKETLYLRTAQDHATQDEVKQEFGLPHTMKTLPDGRSSWIYQIWTWQPGDYRMTAPGMWCEEYRMTFDHQTILRNWTQQRHFHGGEAFPDQCLPDYQSSSAF